jgi:hypothetical protein
MSIWRVASECVLTLALTGRLARTQHVLQTACYSIDEAMAVSL